MMEIDGASNNGVEQVRDLRDSARFMPARGRFSDLRDRRGAPCSAPGPSTLCSRRWRSRPRT
ncbi:MAG: hypothetical protein U1G05_00210 [Kiritimatiellia bacterium]